MRFPPLVRSIARGTLHGVSAWLAYAVTEYAFVAIAPRVFRAQLDYRMLHDEFSARLFLLYAGVGLVLGGLAGAVLSIRGNTPSGARLSAAALATVAAVFAANVGRELIGRPSALPLSLLALAAVLTVALVLAAASPAGRERLRFLAHPAVVALVLVAPPWITKDLLPHHSVSLRAGGALAFCLLVAAVSFLLHRIAGRRRPDAGESFPWGALGQSALLSVAIFAVGFWMNRVPGVPPASASASLPNHVVIVVLDTVRSDHMSIYGYDLPTTPRLEEFAREATVYTRAIASGDMTLSTHGSLFTGKYAREHGAHHPDPGTGAGGAPAALDGRFETLAEILADDGFLTAGVVANHGYLGPFFRLNQGFAYWDSRAAAEWTSAKYYLRSGIRRAWLRRPASPEESHRAFRSADDINREIFALLDRVGGADIRLCLFVNYMDAHFPYVPPPPFDTMFPGRSSGLTVAELDHMRRNVVMGTATVTEEERVHLLSQYDGGIAYVDSRFGLLMDRLRSDGIYDDALIVVTSDHGEAFGERGLMDHGVSVYQDQVYVPLLVKYPGEADAVVIHETVSTVDVLPTVLEALQLDPPEGVRGRSLRAPSGEFARPIIAEHYPFDAMARHDPDAVAERAIYSGDRKLIRSTSGKTELYDLKADPDELHDIYGTGETSADLVARLERWLEETVAPEVTAGALDAETAERLEALGYTQ